MLTLIDDRHVGRAADERQVIWAAVALAETGQLAQAKGHDFAYVNPNGEAVSRYGIGMTLLQLPAALLAPYVEKRLGPASSQPLFLVAPILLVLLSSWFAAFAARNLLGGAAGSVPAILLCAVGSPLASYAATSFSEPLQAASIGGAYALSIAAVRGQEPAFRRRWAVLAGGVAGLGLLAKSSLLVVTPAALLPLLAASNRTERLRNLLYAGAGFVPGAAIWLGFELVRFGRVFTSYPGEGFTHPFSDGLWRLLISPNQGFLLFFPAVLVPGILLIRALLRQRWQETLLFGGAVAPLIVLLAMSAGWWAWHGVWGWGPRFLVPAVPPVAAAATAGLRRVGRWVLIGLSFSINLPGLWQHPIPITNYYSNLVWPHASAEFARSLPGYAVQRAEDGTYRVSPDHVLATVPRASPFIVFPWFSQAIRSSSADRALEALHSPPWVGVRPDIVPPSYADSPDWMLAFAGPERARGWGRGFWPSTQDAQYAAVYDEALADQVLRLLQRREGAKALALAQRLVGLVPDGEYDALVLESYRLLGDPLSAARYLQGLPVSRRVSPSVNVVLALFERDAGNEQTARRFLASVASRFPPDVPLQRAMHAGLAEWPADLQGMTMPRVKLAGER